MRFRSLAQASRTRSKKVDFTRGVCKVDFTRGYVKSTLQRGVCKVDFIPGGEIRSLAHASRSRDPNINFLYRGGVYMTSIDLD